MKYNELHKLLRKAGCVELNAKGSTHPVWLNPANGKKFFTSHHLSKEVASGTLQKIKKAAGLS